MRQGKDGAGYAWISAMIAGIATNTPKTYELEAVSDQITQKKDYKYSMGDLSRRQPNDCPGLDRPV